MHEHITTSFCTDLQFSHLAEIRCSFVKKIQSYFFYLNSNTTVDSGVSSVCMMAVIGRSMKVPGKYIR